MAHISYETYNKGGYLIEFWLKPAVVALGVPLYLQLEAIKKQLVPILLSQLAGCIIGVVSVVVIAKLMGAPQEIIYSLAPKSVTTPIAMEVADTLGGIPALTAAVVVCVGLLGSIIGIKTLKLTRIKSPIAQGLSLGAAAHAVGTSTAMDISSKYGPTPVSDYAEWHLHRPAYANYFTIIGGAITISLYLCYSLY